MGFIDDMKAKFDSTGDGRLSKEDLDELRNGDNASIIDQLKEKADQNEDGKVDLSDLNGVKDKFSDLKDKLLGH